MRLVVGRTSAPGLCAVGALRRWSAHPVLLFVFDGERSAHVDAWVCDHDVVRLLVLRDADDGFECSLVSGVEPVVWDL